MLEEKPETEEIIQRIAALDIGKATPTCRIRVPGAGSGRLQEVTTHQTMTRYRADLGARIGPVFPRPVLSRAAR